MRKRTIATIAGLGLALVVSGGVTGPAYATGGHGHGHTPVTLCHNGHTITVDAAAAKAHVKHGDKLGECAPKPEPTTPVVTPEPEPTTPVETPAPEPEPTTPVETPAPEPEPTTPVKPPKPADRTKVVVHEGDPQCSAGVVKVSTVHYLWTSYYNAETNSWDFVDENNPALTFVYSTRPLTDAERASCEPTPTPTDEPTTPTPTDEPTPGGTPSTPTPTDEPSTTPPSGEPTTPEPSDAPTTPAPGSPSPTAGTTPPASSTPAPSASTPTVPSPTDTPATNTPSGPSSKAPVAADTSNGSRELAFTGADDLLWPALIALALMASGGIVLVRRRAARSRANSTPDGR